MADRDLVAEQPALKAPAGTATDWYERIERAKAARKLGIQLQSARNAEPQRRPAWQWHVDDARS